MSDPGFANEYANKIPKLPVEMVQCINLLYYYYSRPDYDKMIDFNRIASVIQKNQKLSVFVLNLANNVSSNILSLTNNDRYGNDKKISDVTVALNVLGMTTLLQVIVRYLCKSLEELLNVPKIEKFQTELLTKHVELVSMLSFEVAKRKGLDNLSDFILAGIFHDVGIFVRANSSQWLTKEIMRECITNKVDVIKSEETLEIKTHPQISAEVMKEWGFPENVVLLTYYHHLEEVAGVEALSYTENKMIDIFNFCDSVAHKYGESFIKGHRVGSISGPKMNILDVERIAMPKSELERLITETIDSINSF